MSFLILFLFFLAFIPISIQESSSISAYDVLRSHGLPIGLLPEGVKDFAVDDAGQFQLHLDRPCTAKFETKVRYDATVSGTISYGLIASLSGVTAQELFLWFPVREIRVDVPSSGLIYFDVGVIHKQFSLSLFDTPPQCLPAHTMPHQTTLHDDDEADGERAVL